MSVSVLPLKNAFHGDLWKTAFLQIVSLKSQKFVVHCASLFCLVTHPTMVYEKYNYDDDHDKVNLLSSQDPDDCAQKYAFWQPCITMIDWLCCTVGQPATIVWTYLKRRSHQRKGEILNVHSSNFPAIPHHDVLSIWWKLIKLSTLEENTWRGARVVAGARASPSAPPRRM